MVIFKLERIVCIAYHSSLQLLLPAMWSTAPPTATTAPDVQAALAGQPAEIATRVIVHEIIAARLHGVFDCDWYLLQLLTYNCGDFLKLLFNEASQFLKFGRHFLELLCHVAFQSVYFIADLVLDLLFSGVEIEEPAIRNQPLRHVE